MNHSLSLPETSSATTLYAARTLRQKGLSVFRIPLGSKTPTEPWKHWQHRRPTDGELVKMFEMGQDGPSNIAIVTGAISGLVVVDCDSAKARRYCSVCLPETPWITRTYNGVHFYFAHPGVPVANRGTDLAIGDWILPIHIRGDGGYVLAPGSVHPTGWSYAAGGDWDQPRSSLPAYDGQLLAPPPLPPVRTRNQEVVSPDPAFMLDRARRYLAATPLPEIGYGSDNKTFIAACRLVRGFNLPPEEAEALLWAWCGNREGWTREWVRDKVISAVRHGREPVGGLR